DLPENAKALLGAIEARLDVPITMISTGPERDALILRGAKVVAS
ncbi:MAG: adenylosuccinate synthase, partial [Nonlabens sp.]